MNRTVLAVPWHTCFNRQRHSHCFSSLQVSHSFELQGRKLLRNLLMATSSGAKGKATSTGLSWFYWGTQVLHSRQFAEISRQNRQLLSDTAVSTEGFKFNNFPVSATIKAKVRPVAELASCLHKQVTGMTQGWNAEVSLSQQPTCQFSALLQPDKCIPRTLLKWPSGVAWDAI